MKKIFLYLLIISAILVFSVAGCRLDISLRDIVGKKAAGEEQGFEENLDTSEQPDIDLFNEYFTDIQLDTRTLLPNQGTQFSFIIKEDAWSKFEAKYKKNFTFTCRVFNTETNKFTKGGLLTFSPEYGISGIICLEALEWEFLRAFLRVLP